MAAKEDDGSANDLHFGPITIDVPDDLSDIKRDLKFYQKVGEAYDSRKVGKAASALLSGQKFGYTSADKVVGRILEKQDLIRKTSEGKARSSRMRQKGSQNLWKGIDSSKCA